MEDGLERIEEIKSVLGLPEWFFLWILGGPVAGSVPRTTGVVTISRSSSQLQLYICLGLNRQVQGPPLSFPILERGGGREGGVVSQSAFPHRIPDIIPRNKANISFYFLYFFDQS